MIYEIIITHWAQKITFYACVNVCVCGLLIVYTWISYCKWVILQGSHRLEKYLNLEGILEKSLKIKSALKSTEFTQKP